MDDIQRGELWWVSVKGDDSEPDGRRPALIIQIDAGNKQPSYPNTIVALLSTSGREQLPFHIKLLPSKSNGLLDVSFVKCEQILTISKKRLEDYIGKVTQKEMQQVEDGMRLILGL